MVGHDPFELAVESEHTYILNYLTSCIKENRPELLQNQTNVALDTLTGFVALRHIISV